MKNEAIAVRLAPRVYFDLAHSLRQCGDRRPPDEVVNVAIRAWIAANCPDGDRHGYQWKQLFLPNGTELRLRYQNDYYYAHIVEDQLLYAGISLSPRAWAMTVTGTVRNAWRDIWLRRNAQELWTRACVWRPEGGEHLCYPFMDRRRHARRSAD